LFGFPPAGMLESTLSEPEREAPRVSFRRFSPPPRMRFFESQQEARRRTRRLLLAFAFAVLLFLLAVNGALALTVWLLWGWSGQGATVYPAYFFEVNTGIALLMVLGGWWIEASNLRGGGIVLAQRAGAREARPSSSPEEQRFCNVLQELSIAAGMLPPTPMVLARSRA